MEEAEKMFWSHLLVVLSVPSALLLAMVSVTTACPEEELDEIS